MTTAREILDLLEASTVIDAEIRQFDSMKGEGRVRMPDGKSPAIRYTQIKGIDQKANNGRFPTEADQEKLEKFATRKAKVKVHIKDGRFDAETQIEIVGLK